MTPDAKHIVCDGPECTAKAYLPVALRVALSRESDSRQSGVYGWLFVDRAGRSLHFCPSCSAAYLRGLKDLK